MGGGSLGSAERGGTGTSPLIAQFTVDQMKESYETATRVTREWIQKTKV